MVKIAKSLDVLRSQVNAAYPSRSKSSDGWIGDAAHAARKSDHNPNSYGVVCALDLTHDPAHGLDAGKLAEMLLRNKDSRIKYIISNKRIAYPSDWRWRPYNGLNAHTQHVHISVSDDPVKYDDVRSWNLDGVDTQRPSMPATQGTGVTLKENKVLFYSSVGGFFSSTPFDLSIPTAIRTNNPGAINAVSWVKAYPGYVGDKVTSMSGASPNNTAIFSSPEQGVALWWELLNRYNKEGANTVGEIITKYGGSQDYSSYLKYVVKRTGLSSSFVIKLDDEISLLKLARAMFRYEAGVETPLDDKQIVYGITLGRTRSIVQGSTSVPVIPKPTSLTWWESFKALFK